MKKILLVLFILCQNAFAGFEQKEYNDLLQQQIGAMTNFSQYLFPSDSAKISVLTEQNKQLLLLIKEKGLGHSSVVKGFFTYYFKFRYSANLFAQDKEEDQSISDLKKTVRTVFEKIVEDRGLSEDGFLNITQSVFSEIAAKIKNIKDLSVEDSLHVFLFSSDAEGNNIQTDLARVIAISKANGDTERTFKEAKKFYLKWVGHENFPVARPLYREFDQYLQDQRIKDGIWQIMGLLEMYAGSLDFKITE